MNDAERIAGKRVPVTLTKSGLQIDGKDVPVYSGTVHYWRLERNLWPKILDRVIELGFGMVETYIPWAIHETAPGHFDWGEQDDRKDVEAFMQLCEEKGLWLLVRPGPLINAELTDFGYPEWVLLDPDVQAKTASGSIHFDAAWGLHPPRPFPVPSYASERFFELSAGWFDNIVPVIARHMAPSGCVVAVQSDNETCYLFHDQPYATDYSESSLVLYRSFLSERYRSIANLNSAYGTAYQSFKEVEPPRDCRVDEAADLPIHLDWSGYKEYQVRWSIARFARMLREGGIDAVPIFHDIAWQIVTPLDVSKLEADPDIDWVGMNLYCNKEDYQTAARRLRFLAGATRLPFVPEFGCGLWSHHPKTFLPDEHEFITLAAFMHGMKAVNFYMLVERERWQGSPITRHGEFRPEYADFYLRLGKFLKEFPLWEFERDRQALVLFNYDASRHAKTMTTLNVAHADLFGIPKEVFSIDANLGLAADVAFESDYGNSQNWLGVLGSELARHSCAFDYADTHVDPVRLGRYPLVCMQTLDFMDLGDQEQLLGYVEDGGILVAGPQMPRFDPALAPGKVLGHYLNQPGQTSMGKGKLIWADTQNLPQTVANAVAQQEYRLSGGQAEVTTMRRNGEVLIFCVNPTSEQLTAELEFTGMRTLERVWGEAGKWHGDGSLRFEIPAWSVNILRACDGGEA